MRARRLAAVIACGATVAVGLCVHLLAPRTEVTKAIGDALYATMAYLGVAILAPRARAHAVAAIALAYCVAIECSQLLHAPWLDDLRATLPGHLVLGSGFQAVDLACYVAGVALGVALEVAAVRIIPSARATG